MGSHSYFERLPTEVILMIVDAAGTNLCIALAQCRPEFADYCSDILVRRDHSAVSKSIMLFYSHRVQPENIFDYARDTFDLTEDKQDLWDACLSVCKVTLSYTERSEIIIRLLGGGKLEELTNDTIEKATEAVRLSVSCQYFSIAAAKRIKGVKVRCQDKKWRRFASAIIRLSYNNKEREDLICRLIERARVAIGEEHLNLSHKEDEGWSLSHYLPRYGVEGVRGAAWGTWPPPVMMATEYGAFEVVKSLAEIASLNYYNPLRFPYAPVIVASIQGNLEMLTLFKEHGASFNLPGSSAVHFAASRGLLDVVRYLVNEAGMDINEKDRQQSTPLVCYLMAVRENEAEDPYILAQRNLKIFQNLGADINEHSGTPNSAICIAFAFRQYHHVTALIEEVGARHENIETLQGGSSCFVSRYLCLPPKSSWLNSMDEALCAMVALNRIECFETRQVFSDFAANRLRGAEYPYRGWGNYMFWEFVFQKDIIGGLEG